MDNFQVAIDATAIAMNSAGSAMKENAAYMESLQAQTTQLKATFQDFANNVVGKELVSSILTLANNALGALNTETGATITQWTLLTGVLTGGIVIYGQIAGKLLSTIPAIVSLTKALKAGTATIKMFTSAALPIAAALSAIAVAGWKVYEWYKETHQSLSEYTSQIESNNEQLEKNRDRIAEIEQMSWTDKTPEILDEYDALVQQNEELQRNIDLLEERRNSQAKRQARSSGQVQQGSAYSFDGLLWSTDTEEEAWNTLASTLGMAGASIDEVKEKAKELGYTLQENAIMVKVDADAYNEDLSASMQEYADQLNANHSLNQEQLRDFESLKAEVGERVAGLQQLQAEGETLTDSEQKLITVYEQLIQAEVDATDFTEKYGEALVLTEEQAQNLIKTYPELKDQIEKVGDAYYLVGDGALEAANKIMDANGNIVADEKATVDAVLAQIKRQLDAYAELVRVKMDVYAGYVKSGQKDSELGRQAEAEWIAASEAWNEVQQARLNISSALATGRVTYSEDWKDTGVDTDTSKTAEKATDLALEEFKNLQKDLEHQKELGLIKEEEYYDKLEQLIKDYKAKATAHMKEYGTDVDTINRNMYQYEEEIYKGRAKLANDLAEQQKKAAEEAAQAQKEALEKQKEDFETAVNYVIKQIDEEISKLQDLRDQTEQYYDDKIDAVNKANDALEDQIQYEELLNNIAKAKDRQLYVFQNGQFQYVQDVEAIASAQAELDAYERDKALQKEVENLETLKEQALDSIDKQIEGWEKYKEEWSNVVDQYEEQQDKLIAKQVLGIDIEQENWNTRLTNLQNFVDKYNSILSQLNSINSGSSVSSSSGSGYSFSGSGGSSKYATAEDDPGTYGTKAWQEANSGSSSSKTYSVTKNDKDKATLKSGGSLSYTNPMGKTVNISLKKHALGTASAPGGLSLVGERGPELRVLNSGDGVIPADATRNLWDWSAYSPKDFMGRMGSDNIFHIGNIALPNVTDAKSFVNGLKQLAYQRAYKRA